MTITYHADAKIKIERGAFVVTRAFDIAGQFHDIVISDGSQELTKDNLNIIGESKLRKLAQDIFDGCLLSAESNNASPQTPLEDRRFVYRKNLGKEVFAGHKVEMVVHPDGVKYPIGKKDIIDLFTDLNEFLWIYGRLDFTEGSLEKGVKPSAPDAPAKPTSWASKAFNALKSIPSAVSSIPALGGKKKDPAAAAKAPLDPAKGPEKGDAPSGKAKAPSDKPPAKKGSGGVPLNPDIQDWLEKMNKDQLIHLQTAKGRQWIDTELKGMSHFNQKLREAFKTAISATISERIKKLS